MCLRAISGYLCLLWMNDEVKICNGAPNRKFAKPNNCFENWVSGCGSAGRAIASDTRELRFESQHQLNGIYQLYINT